FITVKTCELALSLPARGSYTWATTRPRPHGGMRRHGGGFRSRAAARPTRVRTQGSPLPLWVRWGRRDFPGGPFFPAGGGRTTADARLVERRGGTHGSWLHVASATLRPSKRTTERPGTKVGSP